MTKRLFRLPPAPHVRHVGSCPVTGKLQFPTEDDALAEVEEWIQNNRFSTSGSNTVYQCEHASCGAWHITSQRLRPEARRKP